MMTNAQAALLASARLEVVTVTVDRRMQPLPGNSRWHSSEVTRRAAEFKSWLDAADAADAKRAADEAAVKSMPLEERVERLEETVRS